MHKKLKTLGNFYSGLLYGIGYFRRSIQKFQLILIHLSVFETYLHDWPRAEVPRLFCVLDPCWWSWTPLGITGIASVFYNIRLDLSVWILLSVDGVTFPLDWSWDYLIRSWIRFICGSVFIEWFAEPNQPFLISLRVMPIVSAWSHFITWWFKMLIEWYSNIHVFRLSIFRKTCLKCGILLVLCILFPINEWKSRFTTRFQEVFYLELL